MCIICTWKSHEHLFSVILLNVNVMYLKSRNWVLLVNGKMRWKCMSLWHFYEYFNNSYSSFEKKNIWFPFSRSRKKRRFNEGHVLCIFPNVSRTSVSKLFSVSDSFKFSCTSIRICDHEHCVLLKISEKRFLNVLTNVKSQMHFFLCIMV